MANKDNLNDLSADQQDSVNQYRKIHTRLHALQSQMDSIKQETQDLVQELNKLRNQDEFILASKDQDKNKK